MEKNLVVTMTIEEAKRFENDCTQIKKVFDKFIESLPKIEDNEEKRKFVELGINEHVKRLETITDVFRTS